MREPTKQELWYLEDVFGDQNDADDVSVEYLDETETGWTALVQYDIVEGNDIVDTQSIDGMLWYDVEEDTFHLNVNGQVY